MAWEVWLLFALTETALCFTPGPAVLLVVSQGLARGARASIWSNLGILGGNTLYFVLSATSLGAVLIASYELFAVIRWVGAAYLIWLGVAVIRGRSAVLSVVPSSTRSDTTVRARRMFVNGFVLQAANPKALVFFTALLPQFIDPRGSMITQVAILAVTSVVIEFCVLLAYGALAGRMTTLAARPPFATLANRLAGSMLVAAGVSTATLRRG
ncbi:MAG: LysE family translocator [Candidatus Rokuibacteriota bacterium]